MNFERFSGKFSAVNFIYWDEGISILKQLQVMATLVFSVTVWLP